MGFLKKILLFCLHILIKIINIFAIIITICLAIILYIIIFEVPINFFNKYISEKIFHNLVQINNIYLKWDYNIKKPIIILKNIKYNNPDKKIAFSFKHIGVGFDIGKLVVQRKFYPIYINLKGFELYGIRYKDNNFAFNLNQSEAEDIIYDYKYQTTNTLVKTNTKEKIKSTAPYSENFNLNNFLKEGIFDYVMEYKKKYKSISMLNRIDIDSSIIKFKDEAVSRDFKIDIDNLNIVYSPSNNKIVLQSRAHIKDLDHSTIIGAKGSVTADNKKNLFFNYIVDNLPTELVLLYFNKDLAKDVKTAGLPIYANIEGKYQFPYGFKNIISSIEVGDGELFIKNILSEKIGIKNINTNIDYNINTGKINIQHFGMNFSNIYHLRLKALNDGEIPLKSFKFSAIFDTNNNLYDFNNININILDKYINAKANYSNQNINFVLNTSSIFNIGDLKNIWPATFNNNTRKWLINNVKKACVEQAQINGELSIKDKKVTLNKIVGTSLLTNVQLTYLNGMPEAYAPKVMLSFDKRQLNIKYFNASTGNIFCETGEVKIYDEYPNKPNYSPNLIVNSKAYSNIVDALLFINNKPLYLLDKSKLTAEKFDGVVAGQVYLEYSFANKKVHNININLVGNNINFKDAFKNKDLKNVNLNLRVCDTNFDAYGSGSYFDMPVNLYLNVDWNDKTPYSLKLNIESNDAPINKLEEINILEPFFRNKMKGTLDLSVEIQQLKKSNKQFIKANLNLTKTHISPLTFLDYTKDSKVPLRAILELSLIDAKLKEIKKLSLHGDGINSQMRISLNDDKSINIILNKLMLNQYANVKGYIYLAPDNMNININGSYLNVDWILSSYKKYIKSKEDKNSKESKKNLQSTGSKQQLNNKNQQPQINNIDSNYVVRVNINKAESNNVVINNFYINMDLLNKNIDSLVISGDLDSDENITVVYDKSSEKISYNISNLGLALKFLKTSTKIKKGNLNGQINFLQNKENYILTDGKILIKNFTLGVLPFSSVNITFTGRDLNFNIIEMLLKGNVVGGNLSGKYNGNNNYLTLSGYITPIWSASHLLVNIPILGDFLKSNFAQSFLSSGVNKDKSNTSNKGAVNIPFNIYGDISNLQYHFSNPTQEQIKLNQLYTNTNDN